MAWRMRRLLLSAFWSGCAAMNCSIRSVASATPSSPGLAARPGSASISSALDWLTISRTCCWVAQPVVVKTSAAAQATQASRCTMRSG